MATMTTATTDAKMRDSEILRTLGRLRFATTSELIGAFFRGAQAGRRRLRRLADHDLIVLHQKGARFGYRAWRLTARGIALLERSFPDEVLPDGITDKLGSASLFDVDHRTALTQLYLDIVTLDEPLADEADLAALAERTAAVRARASSFWWQPDGDVVLRMVHRGAPLQKIPDVTVCGRDRAVRVFVELDRSSLTLGRIAEGLERYRMYLADLYTKEFPDGREPYVLFVVGSEARRAGIRRETTRILGNACRWDVVLEREAGRFLSELVGAHDSCDAAGGDDAAAAPEHDLRAAARSVYRWARAHQEHLKVEGKELSPDGEQALLDLHQALRQVRRAG